jgi:hypothetical protein
MLFKQGTQVSGKMKEEVQVDEYGEPMLLFGDNIGEILQVSSERDFGKFENIKNNSGAWHAAAPKHSDVSYAIVDFGGEGDEAYEIDHIRLQNEHSSSYCISSRDIDINGVSTWHVNQDWTAVEPYELFTLKKKKFTAVEMKLSVKGKTPWDGSWIIFKVYGRIDPVRNYMRKLAHAIGCGDSLEDLTKLVKEGMQLDLLHEDSVKRAICIRDFLLLRQEIAFSMERRDLVALEKCIEQANLLKKSQDVQVLQAIDIIAEIRREVNWRETHPAFKVMLLAGIEAAAATKYLPFLFEKGYDCLYALATVTDVVFMANDFGMSSRMNCQRLLKQISHLVLPKLNSASLNAFMLSINVSEKDAAKYEKSLFHRKHDTVYDLFQITREEMQFCGIKNGHIEAILMIAKGDHSRFASEATRR